RSEGRGPAGLDLDEDRGLTVSGDDVEFPAGASEVAFDDDQSGVFQERRRQVLAPAAQGLSAQALGAACAARRSSLSHVGQMTTTGSAVGRADSSPVDGGQPSTGRSRRSRRLILSGWRLSGCPPLQPLIAVGGSRSDLAISSMLTSLNVSTCTVLMNRADRELSHTHASRGVRSKYTSPAPLWRLSSPGVARRKRRSVSATWAKARTPAR